MTPRSVIPRWRSAIVLLAACLLPSMSVSAGESPADMVLIPGGDTVIGSEHGLADERPVFAVTLPDFLLDKTPVTVAAFAEFVAGTGYITTAEQLGDSAVMQFGTGRWFLQPGAYWRYPLGPDGSEALADHPVTQVSWDDATAYCQAQGKRLPSEVEWEFAARSGHDGDVTYAFGDELFKEGDSLAKVWQANVWNGDFPMINTVEDGFATTSPVGHFGLSPAGLSDMAGNVWEWTADWYGGYEGRSGADDAPSDGNSKVQRGGSFLCDKNVCHGYRVSARSHSTPDSSLMHVGFRCARDVN
ncbi:formylglycine-generating enzyme family protein [Pseudohongiella spirulinae]|uniref:Sulphatase-modifying factor protein n=1 Tax=Pseudohongiella spirulinae TaxID=1249552 RepID=A0A0S2KGL7_9GAMM|nr:formylglycine-generating enzyme family protein [Pseudohongiella spirulinae]ALO47448.1 Sulphatase-modifying factor protein [Pseudohongiella spirulinae]